MNGYDVRIRDAWLDDSIDEESISKEIISEKDDIVFVGTSSYMLNNNSSCKLIEKLNNEGINMIAGGYGPTFEPEKFLKSGAKLVMIGEGEKSIVNVANKFSNKDNYIYEDIKGIAFLNDEGDVKYSKEQEIEKNLDTIPFPQRPYLDIVKKRHSTVNVLTSRGCMGACTFCSISSFLSKQHSDRWRGRSIENIIKELKYLQDLGVKTVKFIDDSFIENERDEKWCKNFYEQIKENKINMNFRASIRADKVNSDNMKYLRDAGFFSFSCGIENGSPTALKRMAKRASINDNEKAIKVFRENNIYVQAGFILFDDNTSMQELEENYKFLKNNVDLITKGIFSEMYAAEGTKFTDNIKSQSNDKYASNNIYKVKDEKARKVYDALKKWQLHNSRIYDMIIDPISAPKDIPIKEMEKYHNLMMKMKEVDLLYMREVMDCVKNNKDEKLVFEKFSSEYNSFFKDVNKTIRGYYKDDNLEYDASVNGFLTLNNSSQEKNSKIIIVSRHGESFKNLNKVDGGKGSALTNNGIEQINGVSENISKIVDYLNLPVNIYKSTDRQQVKESAEIIAKRLNSDVKTDKRFTPIKLGRFDGLNSKEQKDLYPKAFDLHHKWQKGLVDIKVSEKEIEDAQTAEDYYNQIDSFVQELPYNTINILVGTRSDVICLYNIFRNQKPSKDMSYKYYDIDYGNADIFVQREGKNKIFKINEIIEKISKKDYKDNSDNDIER